MFNREEILTAHDDEATHKLTSYAVEFAVLGYLNDARDLVTLLNNCNFHQASTSMLRPLWLAWAETDSWPEKEEGRVDEAIEELRESYYEGLVSYAFSFDRIKERLIQDDAAGVVKLLTRADGEDKMSGDETTGGLAMIKSAALSAALELRLRLAEEGGEGGKEEDGHGDLPSVEDILSRIAKRLHSNHQIRDLSQMARAWKILKDGALARAVGVQDVKVTELAREVREAFIERFSRGRKMVVLEPMKDLIKVLEENTRRTMESEDARADFGLDVGLDDDKELEVIQEPGATVGEITQLEERLGVQLPTDYKELLSVSNGLGRSWSGILLDSPLHSAEEVRWDVETDYLTDLAVEFLPINIFATCRDFPGLVEYKKWPKVGRAIQIGQRDIDSVWLLPPATVAKVRDAYLKVIDRADAPQELKATVLNAVRSFAGSRERFERLEWCVMRWLSGGAACMSAYPTFGEYIAEKARSSATDYWGPGEDWKRGCFAYACQ